MIIDPDSEFGRRLLLSGVLMEDLMLTRTVRWPFAGALTIAHVNRTATIFCPAAWFENRQGYGYAWRHELVHVEQARRWGFLGCWRRHLAARLRTRSLLAEADPVEAEAYAAQRAFSAMPR